MIVWQTRIFVRETDLWKNWSLPTGIFGQIGVQIMLRQDFDIKRLEFNFEVEDPKEQPSSVTGHSEAG